MAKTKVTKAPWGADGSLLHYPSDGERFLYRADPVTGERLSDDQIWEQVPSDPARYNPRTGERLTDRKQIRDYAPVYSTVDWRANEPFRATFQIDSMRSGRSAKYVILKAANAPLDTRTYPMFVSDLLDVMMRSGVERGGIMSGRWMISQRGANYGLRLAKEDE